VPGVHAIHSHPTSITAPHPSQGGCRTGESCQHQAGFQTPALQIGGPDRVPEVHHPPTEEQPSPKPPCPGRAPGPRGESPNAWGITKPPSGCQHHQVRSDKARLLPAYGRLLQLNRPSAAFPAELAGQMLEPLRQTNSLDPRAFQDPGKVLPHASGSKPSAPQTYGHQPVHFLLARPSTIDSASRIASAC
jgi:hypothetical protein